MQFARARSNNVGEGQGQKCARIDPLRRSPWLIALPPCCGHRLLMLATDTDRLSYLHPDISII